MKIPEWDISYESHEAPVLARYIQHLDTDCGTGLSFGQQCIHERGLKVFGERAKQGGHKERFLHLDLSQI